MPTVATTMSKRLETPGADGWDRNANPGDANKYFMVSADGHVQEPSDLWATRMDASFKDRLPGVIMDGKGNNDDFYDQYKNAVPVFDYDKLHDKWWYRTLEEEKNI